MKIPDALQMRLHPAAMGERGENCRLKLELDHRLFELDGVELEFSPDALEAVADQAIMRGTGARGHC